MATCSYVVDPCSQPQHHQHNPDNQQVVHVVERNRFYHKEDPEEVDGDEKLVDEERVPGEGEGQGRGDGGREGAHHLAN